MLKISMSLRLKNIIALRIMPHTLFLFFFVWLNSINLCFSVDELDINLPPEHLRYFFGSQPELAQKCSSDPNCLKKTGMKIGAHYCWGYEKDCKPEDAYPVKPECPGDHMGWVKTKAAQIDTFYTQADFGYVKEQIEEMKIMCEPKFPYDSSLECSKHLRFCRARNLMLNFTGLVGKGDHVRYDLNVLGPGQIGGHCKYYEDRLQKEADLMSALQSWAPELRHFVYRDTPVMEDKHCDVVVNKPTYIMKLDAVVNMYHHFCDFFNLYASLHVNSSHPTAFSRDNHVLVWETYTHHSAFVDTWKAFTKNPIWDLKHFRGKVVCFKNIVLPLLPRMIFGLYYNTPLIFGCEKSGLFHAFSRHILHSLDIKKEKRKNRKIRITLLSRETKYRGILNERELLSALSQVADYEVRRAVYNYDTPFPDQLRSTRNTDVFIGMHGAGLTHLLFLPDWAAVFELYHCEDPGCYSNLARLRGVKYITWEKQDKVYPQDEGHHPDEGAHAKFTNYSMDVEEFLRLVEQAASHVRAREDFRRFVEDSLNDIRDEL